MSDPMDQLGRLGAAPPAPPEPLEALRARVRRRHRRRHLVVATSLGLIAVAGLLVVVPNDDDSGKVRTVDDSTPSASAPGSCREGSLTADVDGDGQPDQIDQRPDEVVGAVVLVCLANGRELTSPGVALEQSFVALDVEPDGRFEILASATSSAGGTLYTYSDGHLTRFSLVDDDLGLIAGATAFDDRGNPSETSAYGCEDLSGDNTRELVQVQAAFTATGVSWTKTGYSLSGTFATQVFFDEGVAGLPVDRLTYASSLTSPCSTTDPPTRGTGSCAELNGSEMVVVSYAVTELPTGFSVDGSLEETSTGYVDAGGETHATQRFTDSAGRWIEFDAFGSYDPALYIRKVIDGAPTRQVSYNRCVDLAGGPEPVAYEATVVNDSDGTVLITPEWEYGGYTITGGPGVTQEELLLIAAGLRNAPVVDTGNCPGRPSGSSPATFDASSGTYAVELEGVSTNTMVSFVVVRWLSGQDAVDAYHRDFPDDPDGPPGDYYISRDAFPELRTAQIADGAKVFLVRLATDADPGVSPGTVEELSDYLSTTSENPYWLTFVDGAVTEICEQYTP